MGVPFTVEGCIGFVMRKFIRVQPNNYLYRMVSICSSQRHLGGRNISRKPPTQTSQAAPIPASPASGRCRRRRGPRPRFVGRIFNVTFYILMDYLLLIIALLNFFLHPNNLMLYHQMECREYRTSH